MIEIDADKSDNVPHLLFRLWFNKVLSSMMRFLHSSTLYCTSQRISPAGRVPVLLLLLIFHPWNSIVAAAVVPWRRDSRNVRIVVIVIGSTGLT